MGLTGSYETLQIAQAEVREKCANSILVRGGGLVAVIPLDTVFRGKIVHGTLIPGTVETCNLKI